jgi:hypothetical protein
VYVGLGVPLRCAESLECSWVDLSRGAVAHYFRTAVRIHTATAGA